MGRHSRSRDRSRSRGRSRSRDSSSDSEESEEREIREEQRQLRKAEREEARKQRAEAAKKAATEKAAMEKAQGLQWRFYVPTPAGVTEEEEPFDLMLRAAKPSWSPDVIDTLTWAGERGLNKYLRSVFEVSDSVKIGLKGQVLLNGAPRYYFKASDDPTLSNVHSSIIGLGEHVIGAEKVQVNVELVSLGLGMKLKGKSRPRTHKQDATEAAFKELKAAIYGIKVCYEQDGVQHERTDLHYEQEGVQCGEWTPAASDLMRRDRTSLAKFHETRALTEVVMGCADYHPNPCVFICPFKTCRKSQYHLNGFSAISQLYSHWQKKHSENKAARVLEARLRLANDNKKVRNLSALLDGQVPLILDNEEMERLGGQEAGYEEVRMPQPSAADFKHRLDLSSREHFDWLAATGTI